CCRAESVLPDGLGAGPRDLRRPRGRFLELAGGPLQQPDRPLAEPSAHRSRPDVGGLGGAAGGGVTPSPAAADGSGSGGFPVAKTAVSRACRPSGPGKWKPPTTMSGRPSWFRSPTSIVARFV